jgi:hypothetical protein
MKSIFAGSPAGAAPGDTAQTSTAMKKPLNT